MGRLAVATRVIDERLTSTGAAEVSIELLGGAFGLWTAGTNGPGNLDVGELDLPSDHWSR